MQNLNDSWLRLKKATPLGGQTLSKLPDKFVNGVYPKILHNGVGPRVFDLEGKSYIDLISGLGCISVGYANNEINQAVMRQMELGTSFSLPNMIEAEVSEKLQELMPWTEMWKYGKNGTDATLMAVRCARAYTGRTKILTTGYHGCTDHFECLGTRRAGMVDMSETTVQWDGTLEAITPDYAALIIEPFIFDLPTSSYLHNLRNRCSQMGVMFIMDEVVTGGRMERFTASRYFALAPDLICIGKAIANGFPLSAVGGLKHIMQTFERDDFFASGTFFGECASLAACLATIRILEKKIPWMLDCGKAIQQQFNHLFHQAICKGYPTRLTFDFPSVEQKAVFMQEMCLKGVLIGYSNSVMADYTEEDLATVLKALNHVDMTSNLKGDAPKEALRKR